MPNDRPGVAGRIPPQAIEAEQAALGAALLDRQAIWSLQEHLVPADFYSKKHQHVYEAILHLADGDVGVDLVTLSDELKRLGRLQEVGGAYYLSELTTVSTTPANAERYALIVREKAMLRRLIKVTTQATMSAYDPTTDVFEVLDEAERDILEVRGIEGAGRRDISRLMRDQLVKLEAIHGADRGITGVESGLPSIDRITTGWQPGNFILIAARPSMGKTALGLQVAKSAAMAGTPVVVFSIEMGADECAHRLLTSEARVDSHQARSGRLRDDDWTKLGRAAGRLADIPMFIDDSPALSDMSLRSKLRRLHHDQKIGLAVVDYIQLMHATGLNRNANREQEISTISRSIKRIAKELHIPVIGLSQLSRAVEQRGGDRRPQLSDLRESGSLEQDADLVAFIYRAEYYGIHHDEEGNPTSGLAEIIIGKQRNGPTGTRTLAWVKEFGRFEPLARDVQTDAPVGLPFEEPQRDAPLPF